MPAASATRQREGGESAEGSTWAGSAAENRCLPCCPGLLCRHSLWKGRGAVVLEGGNHAIVCRLAGDAARAGGDGEPALRREQGLDGAVQRQGHVGLETAVGEDDHYPVRGRRGQADCRREAGE